MNFRYLTNDVRICCRQYFIPGAGDVAHVQRHRAMSLKAFKWNATAGIPLREIESYPPSKLGQPQRLSGWPDLYHLLVVLDKAGNGHQEGRVACSSRYIMPCSRCGKSILPSHFAAVCAKMESALATGRASLVCTLVGMQCLPQSQRSSAVSQSTTDPVQSTAVSSQPGVGVAQPGAAAPVVSQLVATVSQPVVETSPRELSMLSAEGVQVAFEAGSSSVSASSSSRQGEEESSQGASPSSILAAMEARLLEAQAKVAEFERRTLAALALLL